jgi:hypothetical protein
MQIKPRGANLEIQYWKFVSIGSHACIEARLAFAARLHTSAAAAQNAKMPT